MSKYYKVEDVIRAIEEMQNCYNGWSDTYDKAQIIGTLEELPTIEVCEDCISREWLLKYITNGVGALADNTETFVEVIKNAPSVTTEQSSMVGEWVELGQNKDKTHNIRCKACGAAFKSRGHANSFYTKERFRFCLACGAKMKI